MAHDTTDDVGHVFNAVHQAGKLFCVDAQKGLVLSDRDFSKYTSFRFIITKEGK